MANNDFPQGFKPYGKIKQTVTLEAGSEIFPGDCVSLASDGQYDATVAGSTINGVALSYASGAGVAFLASVDPEQLYIAQASGSEINAQTLIGNNADILATAGSSTYKTSRMEVDSSTAAASAANLTVIALRPRVGNAFGANAELIVRINEHQAFGKDAFAGI